MTSVKILSFKGLPAGMAAILVASVMLSPTISESASRKGSGGVPVLRPAAPKQPSARRPSTSPAPRYAFVCWGGRVQCPSAFVTIHSWRMTS